MRVGYAATPATVIFFYGAKLGKAFDTHCSARTAAEHLV